MLLEDMKDFNMSKPKVFLRHKIVKISSKLIYGQVNDISTDFLTKHLTK